MAIDTTGWKAQDHIDYWVNLSVQVGQGRDVTHGSKRLTQHDLGSIRHQINFWTRKLNAEKAAAAGQKTSSKRSLANWSQ